MQVTERLIYKKNKFMDFEELLKKTTRNIESELEYLRVLTGELLGTITFLLAIIMILGIIGLVHFW